MPEALTGAWASIYGSSLSAQYGLYIISLATLVLQPWYYNPGITIYGVKAVIVQYILTAYSYNLILQPDLTT